MPSNDDDKHPPLEGATDSDVNRLVDDVLRSGKHLTLPGDAGTTPPERYHAGVIAQQMKRLAQHISTGAPLEAADEHDEWWFEVGGRRIGPISLKKIRFLWEDGELTPDSLCWHEGFPKWVSLFKVSDLAEALTPKLKVDVAAAAGALSPMETSGEWKSPAASAIESGNRKRLESAQHRHEPLPLATPIDLTDQTAAAYTALRSVPIDDDDDDETPRARSGFGHTLLSGLVAGAIASGTLVALRFYWPITVPPPIVVTMTTAAPTKPAVTPAPLPPAEPAAPAPAALKPAAGPPKSADPEPAKQPPTLEEAFATTFTQPPPDELSLSEVFEVVKAHKAQADACAAADSNGRQMMSWTVEPNGRVKDVSPSSGSPQLECLAKEISSWTFPKHAVGRTVEMPFKH